jgi:hypothetical protein
MSDVTHPKYPDESWDPINTGFDDTRRVYEQHEVRDRVKAAEEAGFAAGVSAMRDVAFDFHDMTHVVVPKSNGGYLDRAIATAREDALTRIREQFSRGFPLHSSKGCPMCVYKDGKFISSCIAHKELDKARAARDAERERCAKFCEVRPYSSGPALAAAIRGDR